MAGGWPASSGAGSGVTFHSTRAAGVMFSSSSASLSTELGRATGPGAPSDSWRRVPTTVPCMSVSIPARRDTSFVTSATDFFSCFTSSRSSAPPPPSPPPCCLWKSRACADSIESWLSAPKLFARARGSSDDDSIASARSLRPRDMRRVGAGGPVTAGAVPRPMPPMAPPGIVDGPATECRRISETDRPPTTASSSLSDSITPSVDRRRSFSSLFLSFAERCFVPCCVMRATASLRNFSASPGKSCSTSSMSSAFRPCTSTFVIAFTVLTRFMFASRAISPKKLPSWSTATVRSLASSTCTLPCAMKYMSRPTSPLRTIAWPARYTCGYSLTEMAAMKPSSQSWKSGTFSSMSRWRSCASSANMAGGSSLRRWMPSKSRLWVARYS
mmetsp:Transcript_12556/g.43597  ORF Transcript_12556/g.43597 Transcript_12556/m.43597 type:complete len:386 (+) Transcript_12556:103-1260(+)